MLNKDSRELRYAERRPERVLEDKIPYPGKYIPNSYHSVLKWDFNKYKNKLLCFILLKLIEKEFSTLNSSVLTKKKQGELNWKQIEITSLQVKYSPWATTTPSQAHLSPTPAPAAVCA